MTAELFWLSLLNNKLPHSFYGQEFRIGWVMQFSPVVADSGWSHSLPVGCPEQLGSHFSPFSHGLGLFYLFSPWGLVGLPHSMVALKQLDCLHSSSGFQSQYLRNEAEAACFLQPILRNHTVTPTSFYWL